MLRWNGIIVPIGLAALAVGGGCYRSSKPAPLPPQTQTFATIDKLVNQVEAIPDAAKRDELMGTIERIRGQLTFGQVKMPPAARLLLAKDIQILPMTQVADWNNDGTPDGFEVQIEAFDHFGDPTKLVGKLYFELYAYRQAHADRRALQRTAYWEVNIETVDDCLRYWDRFERAYHFNLVWPTVPEAGRKYIFQVTYVAPWGEVLEAQRTLTRTR
ncbi:MAG: hypothetical protein PHU85_17415 [Phycisphaerae bacterium]|nr:hypothetical protein [Phycisphaerae bacterium]